jgi:hypothetical protein
MISLAAKADADGFIQPMLGYEELCKLVRKVWSDKMQLVQRGCEHTESVVVSPANQETRKPNLIQNSGVEDRRSTVSTVQVAQYIRNIGL